MASRRLTLLRYIGLAAVARRTGLVALRSGSRLPAFRTAHRFDRRSPDRSAATGMAGASLRPFQSRRCDATVGSPCPFLQARVAPGASTCDLGLFEQLLPLT
jgi:hypothetical protein